MKAESAVPFHVPTLAEFGLGRVEFDAMLANGIGELADPAPLAPKKSTVYTPEQRASIGKYALLNGMERARHDFQPRFPNLNESTIQNFKKAYKERLAHERKQGHPQSVTTITAQPWGRPPILLELDGKLFQYLKALRSKGGVVNIHVVRAVTKALIESNPSMSQLATFDRDQYMRKQFIVYYSSAVKQQLESSKQLEGVDVPEKNCSPEVYAEM